MTLEPALNSSAVIYDSRVLQLLQATDSFPYYIQHYCWQDSHNVIEVCVRGLL